MFIAYKTAMKAMTAANKLFGKSLSKTGLNVYAIALTAIVAIVFELVDAFKEAEDASNLMARMQEEVTEKLDKEKLALEQVKEQLLLTTAGSEERQKILDETNRKYGTTLQNLEDEAAFVDQVTAAYTDLIAKLEERLEAEVREAFLKDLIEQRFNIQKLIRETEELDIADTFKRAAMEDALTQLQDINDQILLLKEEIKEGGGLEVDIDTGEDEGTGTVVSRKVVDDRDLENIELMNTGLGKTKDLLKEFVNELKDVEEGDLFGALTGGLGLLVDQQKEIDEKAKKAREERIKELKKFRDESLAIVKEITDGITKNIDKRIDERQREIDESKQEVERLRDLASQGNVEAAKSIKAEQVAIAKEKLEIERLENKKKNLLITVVALERASQLIGSGDGNPFANASSQLSDFFAGLPKASEGTDYSVAQTFGQANKPGQDGHLAWVDKKEKILSIKNSEKLSGMHQDEVTRRALAYENNLVSTKAMSDTEIKMFTDKNIVGEIKELKEVIVKMKPILYKFDLKNGLEIKQDDNKTTVTNHRPSTFRI
jgi:hypothetical protein